MRINYWLKFIAVTFTLMVMLGVSVQSSAQVIDYSSRHVSCQLLRYEWERVLRENEGDGKESWILTVARAITFPMLLLEPYSGYNYQRPPNHEIGQQAQFSGHPRDLFNAAKSRNCIRIVPKMREMDLNGELDQLKAYSVANYIRRGNFYYDAPFK